MNCTGPLVEEVMHSKLAAVSVAVAIIRSARVRMLVGVGVALVFEPRMNPVAVARIQLQDGVSRAHSRNARDRHEVVT